MVRPFVPLKKGDQLHVIWSLSCLIRADVRAFFALQIVTKSHLLTLRAQIEQGSPAPMEQSDLDLHFLHVYLR